MEVIQKTLSVALPCLNEEKVIQETIQRLDSLAASLAPHWRVEIVIVDDGSTDQTVGNALSVVLHDASLKVIEFTRNFGHQAAVTAAIDYCSSDYLVVIDADLQDPPELIPEMLRIAESGADVVYAQRISRKGISPLLGWAYHTYYRVFRWLTPEVNIPVDAGDFRLMSQRAVLAVRDLPERNRYVRGLVPYLGLKSESVEYVREARKAGASKYNFGRLISLGFDGIVSFSGRPLRLAFWLGGSSLVVSILGVLAVLIIRLATDNWVPGWAGTMILLFTFGGLQLFAIGLLGEYIGRLLIEVKRRPIYRTKT